MFMKQCKLIATLCKLPRAAEHALSTAAVRQMSRELDSINYNSNDDSDDANNEKQSQQYDQ